MMVKKMEKMTKMIAISRMRNKANPQSEAPPVQSFLRKSPQSPVPNNPAANNSGHKNWSPPNPKPTSKTPTNGNTTAKTPTAPIRTSHISIDN